VTRRHVSTRSSDFTFETETEHLIREGVPPAEARRRALVAFGAVEGYREAMRDERGARWFDDLRADLRYAVSVCEERPRQWESGLVTGVFPRSAVESRALPAAALAASRVPEGSPCCRSAKTPVRPT
jgi:hypothetical protein